MTWALVKLNPIFRRFADFVDFPKLYLVKPDLARVATFWARKNPSCHPLSPKKPEGKSQKPAPERAATSEPVARAGRKKPGPTHH